MPPLTRFRAALRGRPALLIAVLVTVGAVVGYAAWSQRWAIGGQAVAIVDPVVRRWAAAEVARLSEGVYRLTASTITVDEARRRLGLDSIVITTDDAANRRRALPRPTITLRLLDCALDGIDLDRLAAGRGLHVTHAGCASVALDGDVPPPPEGAAANDPPGRFLSLRENLDLPRSIPFVLIDTIAFPDVELALGITGRSRRKTELTLDRLAVRLDSLHYDRRQSPEERGPLLSRDVRIRLDQFDGSREGASRLRLDSLSASLARGSFQLDGLVYEPMPGSFGDSLGFQALAVGHLALGGVDWRGFLTAGDIAVGTLDVADATMRFPPRTAEPGAAPAGTTAAPTTARSVGAILRALGRAIRLDTLTIARARLVEGAAVPADSIVTALQRLEVLGARFDDSASWQTPFPAGRVTIAADGFARRQRERQLLLGSFRMSVPAGTARADSLRFGPDGSDAAFQRRHRYRTDRLVLAAAGVELLGLDLPAFLDHGAIRLRRADARGVDLDILTDKRKPKAPGRTVTHRYPQQVLRDVGLLLGADTITLAGTARYREHAAGAPRPGVVSFTDLKATLLNLSTDPARMSDSTPFRLVADARLMGAGAFHFELEMPLLAERFGMRYRGRLGPMPAAALNAFAADGAGIRFTSGELAGIRFEARVTDGRARGRIEPRWRDLGVELPGLSRGNTGILGGIKRAAAKFVANAFLVRDDNLPGGKSPPRDGVIDHRWRPSETLPQFLWNSLRDPLVPLMRR